MNWKEHKKQLMKDPEFRKEYEALDHEYKLAAALIRLRLAKSDIRSVQEARHTERIARGPEQM